MNDVPQLAPDEPLSPELVLVLPAELRAQVLARLGPPVRPAPPPRTVALPAVAPPRAAFPKEALAALAPPVEDEPFARALGSVLATRLAQLGLVFFVVTIVTLALSVVAQAFH
jgi:hypothetical protein